MPLIILDRDGVINEDSDEYIKRSEEWVPIPGSLAAIAQLTRHGYQIAIATNQSGLGRQLFSLDALESIHAKLRSAVEEVGGRIDMIAFCPHHPDDKCVCRKPNIGLLLQIHRQLPVDTDTTWFVGDTLKDIEAARKMGIRGALVLTGKGERTITKGLVSRETTPVFADLRSFANWLLAS